MWLLLMVNGECGGCAVAVPLEAVGFLGAVAVFLLLLLVFALYLNKAFWLRQLRRLPLHRPDAQERRQISR